MVDGGEFVIIALATYGTRVCTGTVFLSHTSHANATNIIFAMLWWAVSFSSLAVNSVSDRNLTVDFGVPSFGVNGEEGGVEYSALPPSLPGAHLRVARTVEYCTVIPEIQPAWHVVVLCTGIVARYSMIPPCLTTRYYVPVRSSSKIFKSRRRTTKFKKTSQHDWNSKDAVSFLAVGQQ
jgi:hypothetical protein